MICPKCKALIDDDSFFCDQCGNEINVCPKCGKPGRGKVCTDDAAKLVPAKSRKQNAGPRTSDGSTEPGPEPMMEESVSPQGLSSRIRLLNKSLAMEIAPNPGDVLGRKVGPFADVFAPHKQVSGEHARMTFDHSHGWCVVDLGSTNGTKYNGQRLQPHILQSLQDKSHLVIANIEFYVRIESEVDSLRTVRA